MIIIGGYHFLNFSDLACHLEYAGIGVSQCFQGLEKGCIENKWVNSISHCILICTQFLALFDLIYTMFSQSSSLLMHLPSESLKSIFRIS